MYIYDKFVFEGPSPPELSDASWLQPLKPMPLSGIGPSDRPKLCFHFRPETKMPQKLGFRFTLKTKLHSLFRPKKKMKIEWNALF